MSSFLGEKTESSLLGFRQSGKSISVKGPEGVCLSVAQVGGQTCRLYLVSGFVSPSSAGLFLLTSVHHHESSTKKLTQSLE